VALALGFFDGVHRGHQRLIERAAKLAAERGARPVALTFWPHPLATTAMHLESSADLLTTLDEKLAALAVLRLLDTTVVLPFTPEQPAPLPDAFLDHLSGWCEPIALVTGPHGADEQVRLLTAAQHRSLAVERVEVREGGWRISSERIRQAVRAGQVDEATRLLGRPYLLTGEVVTGDRRGRLLGFPTANLRLDERKILPANGVYAVRVRLPGEVSAGHPGVANIGVRPTFSGERKLLVEVHLLDATMDLYGLTLGVELIAWLREERRFEGVEALKEQIGRDARTARERLAGDAAMHDAGSEAGTEKESDAPWAS
jgi:riboflavin kinase/FMN adenylyltransferase